MCVFFSDISITSLRLIGSQLGELTFSWDLVTVNITDCPSIVYVINTTSGCGVCPQNVSTNTVTCRDLRGGSNCTFSVYADLCFDMTRIATIAVTTGLGSPTTGHCSCSNIIIILCDSGCGHKHIMICTKEFAVGAG